MSAIEASNLAKRYGDILAVDDVSLRVEHGEVVVLLGPNGAGKTTTVEILEGLREPDTGEIRVLGSHPGSLDVRERIGVMPQRGDLYAGIRTEEALRLFASFYRDASDTDTLLERLGLASVRKTTYRRLSGGERRRLSLALAVVGRPTVAFLDEPTAEMDVEGRAEAWRVVRELRDAGSAVIVTTHQLDDAERVADRVAVMSAGRIVASGSLAELASGRADDVTLRLATRIDPDALSAATGAMVEATGATTYRVSGVVPDPVFVSRITTWLAARHVMVRELRVGVRSLEDIYLELTR